MLNTRVHTECFQSYIRRMCIDRPIELPSVAGVGIGFVWVECQFMSFPLSPSQLSTAQLKSVQLSTVSTAGTAQHSHPGYRYMRQ